MLSDIVSDTMKSSQPISITLLCYGFEVLKARNGSNYLQFKAQDSSGIIGCKMWNYKTTNIPEEMPYDINCVINEYNGVVSFEIKNFLPRIDLSASLFALKYVNDNEFVTLVERVDSLIREIKNRKIAKIVYNVFRDYGLYSKTLPELFNSPIATATGAVLHHHVGWGGLLKHTCEVATRAVSYINNSKVVNRDLVIAGALLHDIGKIFSYELSGGHYSITKRGNLIGHIGIGIEILDKYLVDDNSDIIVMIQHIIASHHDKVEWGALTRPQTLEAVLVSQADLADCIEELLVNAECLYPEKESHKVMGMHLYSPHTVSAMLK